jgi:hypothetical protein
VSVRKVPESFESVGFGLRIGLERAGSPMIRLPAPIREVPDVDDRDPSST